MLLTASCLFYFFFFFSSLFTFVLYMEQFYCPICSTLLILNTELVSYLKKRLRSFSLLFFLLSTDQYIYFKLLTTFKNNLSTNLVSYTLKNVLFSSSSSSHYKVEASQFLIDSNQCIDFSSSIICCCFTFFKK